MKFETVAESFNFYRNASIQQIETRAAEIKGTIETDPKADVMSLNVEIQGLNAAKENIAAKEVPPTEPAQRGQFNPITGGSFESRASQEALVGDVFDSKEYRSAFFKTLLGQQLTTFETAAFNRAQDVQKMEHRADAFNTATSAAAVLPTSTLNEIVSKARTMGGFVSEARNFNIPTKISVPVGTPGTKAGVHVEGAVVESEKNAVANVSFDGFEIMKVFSISAKAKRMSVAAFETYMIEELTNSVMECIADWMINGPGTTEGSGLETITWVKNTNAIEYVKGAIPTYTDFVSTMAKLKRGYSKGAKWFLNNATLFTHVYNVVDTNKRPIFIQVPKMKASVIF